jgi:hypothetical protein
MTIIENFSFNSYLNTVKDSNGTFQAKIEQENIPKILLTNKKQTKSERLEWLELLYGYPPKLKVKWEGLDDLKQDLFTNYKNGILENSFPFIDNIDELSKVENVDASVGENYKIENYVNGYLDKVNTTNFYKQKTKKLQNSLRKVPVFVIQNCNGEIVLAKPNSEIRVPTWQQLKKVSYLQTKSNVLRKQNIQNFLHEKAYDFCGGFDSRIEKLSHLGLFFMNRVDAENYLKEVALSDINGTKAVGLSIHCIGLDSAYRITREHHPGIDFRLVPDFTDLKFLLSQGFNKSDFLVDVNQQQLRIRPRGVNLFKILGKYGRYISPTSSFLQRDEYFKGVPIYIVQISDNQRNLLHEQYFNLIGFTDTVLGKFTRYFHSISGFGQNWVMQGSLQSLAKSDKYANYIFFEKDQAAKFVANQGRKAERYSGSRTSNFGSIIRKPKIFISNLEDFIELCEDKLQMSLSNDTTESSETLFNTKATYFVPPTASTNDMLTIKNSSQTIGQGKKLQTAFSVKARVLKRSVSMWLGILT